MLKILLLQIVTLISLTINAQNYVQMSATALEIDNNRYVAVHLSNTEGWHTYWKNPGDAGLPLKFIFSINNQEIDLNELEWPVPKRYIEQGDILAYGYSGENTFFFEVSKLNYEKIINKTLLINGQWLVCKDICIPGEGKIDLTFDSNLPLNTSNNKTTISTIIERFNDLPKTIDHFDNFEINLVKANEVNTLALQYSLSNIDIKKFDKEINLLTPFLQVPFDFKKEKIIYDKETNTLFGRMLIKWDGEYEDPKWPLPTDGIFKRPINIKFLLQDKGKKRVTVLSKELSTFSLEGFDQYESFLANRTLDELNADYSNNSTESIIYYIIFAFLGGLILNLMPCVLPVISLKLFGLLSHIQESKKKVLKHNLFYSLGIWTTFMSLGIVVITLKLSGEKIGWGFQLQSPLFVFIMLSIIFIMALNLFGLFEFVTPGGKSLGSKTFKEGFISDFFNGVLATILSTPCSAPFLGVALTFAFTTNNFNIFLIFTSISLGLAFPFLMTGFFPILIGFLPKPGMWMVKLKYFLGFTMLITFAWLYDVLFALIDSSIFGISIHLFFATLFFAYFLRKNITKKFIFNFIFFAIPMVIFVSLYTSEGFKVNLDDKQVKIVSNLEWKPWSKEEMQKSIRNQKWAFIDFTAAWCLTCKVNKKLVLDTDNFSTLVKEKNMDLILGDWTKRDEKITDFLRQYKVVGVPAYFLQDPLGKIIHLGETISIQKIKENMN